MSAALFSPEFREDPYVFFNYLRDATPRVRTDFGMWLLTTHADCNLVVRDPRLSSNEEHSVLNQAFLAQAAAEGRTGGLLDELPIMLTMDPPDHTRLRRLVATAFTPRRVEMVRPRARTIVDGLLGLAVDQAREKGGEIDVIADLAYPLPVTIICEMMGVRLEDHERFSQWSKVLSLSIDPSPLRTPEEEAAIHVAGEAFVDYFVALIDKRRQNPGDDLLSAMITAEDEGDRLTEDELIATGLLLLIAGHETTVNLIGNGMLALLRNPGELDRLREHPDLDKTAVDELLRFDSPVQLTQRIAVDDYQLGDDVVEKGESMIVLLAAANRDPAEFTDPDRLDIGRSPNPHLAFGGGIHHCLGSALARVEGEEAIPRLVRRFPDIALAGEPVRRPNFTLRGLEHLPVKI